MLTRELRPTLNEELKFDIFAFDRIFVALDDVARRHDFLARLDPGNLFVSSGDSSELKLRYPLQFSLGRFDLLGVKTRNLHENAVVALRRNETGSLTP